MYKNFIRRIPLVFNFTKIPGVKKSFLFLSMIVGISSCNWTTGVFEKNLTFTNQEWPSSIKPDIAFEISDTVSLYNVYIVLRHTDAYHFNNIYIRATVREPGDEKGKTGDYDLQLATNDKGWFGTAMDDIYDARLLIQPKTKFVKSGVYHISLVQLMREDPLKNILSAGLRVEKTIE
jgi:gliding motility-associated lipoprotein GldH